LDSKEKKKVPSYELAPGQVWDGDALKGLQNQQLDEVNEEIRVLEKKGNELRKEKKDLKRKIKENDKATEEKIASKKRLQELLVPPMITSNPSMFYSYYSPPGTLPMGSPAHQMLYPSLFIPGKLPIHSMAQEWNFPLNFSRFKLQFKNQVRILNNSTQIP